MLNFLINKNGSSSQLVMSLKNRPYIISNTDEKYAELVHAIKNEATEDDLLAIITAEARKIEEAVSIAEGFEYNAGIVTFDDVPLEQVLGDYIVTLVRDGYPVTGMVNFVKNLFDNPSYRAVKELYSFLRKGNNVITEDGCFLAYKRIKEDYFDVYTGEVLNKPAALMTEAEKATMPRKAKQVTTALEDDFTVVSMRRNMVDEDSSRTCSNGLHVCSYDYLGCYPGQRVVVCKVNPRDVVSIPADYNDTKMRVCRYVVTSELEDLARDMLGTGTMSYDPTDPTDEPFVVEVCDEYDGDWEPYSTFSTYEDARDEHDNLRDDHAGVRVRNKNTGAVLMVVYPEPSDDSDDDDGTTIVIEEVFQDGSTEEAESDVDSDDLEDTLADCLREVVTERMDRVKAVRAVRKRDGEVVEVLRTISFGG